MEGHFNEVRKELIKLIFSGTNPIRTFEFLNKDQLKAYGKKPNECVGILKFENEKETYTSLVEEYEIDCSLNFSNREKILIKQSKMDAASIILKKYEMIDEQINIDESKLPLNVIEELAEMRSLCLTNEIVMEI